MRLATLGSDNGHGTIPNLSGIVDTSQIISVFINRIALLSSLACVGKRNALMTQPIFINVLFGGFPIGVGCVVWFDLRCGVAIYVRCCRAGICCSTFSCLSWFCVYCWCGDVFVQRAHVCGGLRFDLCRNGVSVPRIHVWVCLNFVRI